MRGETRATDRRVGLAKADLVCKCGLQAVEKAPETVDRDIAHVKCE